MGLMVQSGLLVEGVVAWGIHRETYLLSGKVGRMDEERGGGDADVRRPSGSEIFYAPDCDTGTQIGRRRGSLNT